MWSMRHSLTCRAGSHDVWDGGFRAVHDDIQFCDSFSYAPRHGSQRFQRRFRLRGRIFWFATAILFLFRILPLPPHLPPTLPVFLRMPSLSQFFRSRSDGVRRRQLTIGHHGKLQRRGGDNSGFDHRHGSTPGLCRRRRRLCQLEKWRESTK